MDSCGDLLCGWVVVPPVPTRALRSGESVPTCLLPPVTLPERPDTGVPSLPTVGRASLPGDIALPPLPDTPSFPAAAGSVSVRLTPGTELPPPRVCLAEAILFSDLSNRSANDCSLALRPEAPLPIRVPCATVLPVEPL